MILKLGVTREFVQKLNLWPKASRAALMMTVSRLPQVMQSQVEVGLVSSQRNAAERPTRGKSAGRVFCWKSGCRSGRSVLAGV